MDNPRPVLACHPNLMLNLAMISGRLNTNGELAGSDLKRDH
jgi:hypothetical protein